MRRAGMLKRVPDLDIVGATAVGGRPAEGDAISLSNTGVTITGGFASPLNAVMPDKHDYQRLRFVVAPVDHTADGGGDGITGSPTDVEVTIWQRTPDGEMVEFGTAVLQADGTFTDVEGDNHDARYDATVTTLAGGTTPAVNVGVWVQGVHTPTYVATDGA